MFSFVYVWFISSIINKTVFLTYIKKIYIILRLQNGSSTKLSGSNIVWELYVMVSKTNLLPRNCRGWTKTNIPDGKLKSAKKEARALKRLNWKVDDGASEMSSNHGRAKRRTNKVVQ